VVEADAPTDADADADVTLARARELLEAHVATTRWRRRGLASRLAGVIAGAAGTVGAAALAWHELAGH